MKKRTRLILVITAAAMLLLCGCSRNKSASNSGREYGYSDEYYGNYDYAYEAADYEYAMGDSVAAYESKAVPAASNSAAAPAAVQQRMVRKSASINIQVMDPVQVMDAIIALTEEMGGFVVSSSSSQERYSGDIYLPLGELSIRVPSERLMEMLDFIESQTTDTSKYVSNKRIYGVDITSEYVDTQSRLTSLEKTRDKLYEIMDTAENAEQALEVYQSIADVESDIEVYKGQIKYMEESVALSSVDISISSIRPEPIRTVQKWSLGEVVKDAFESLLDSGKDVIEGLIYFLIAVLPVLVLIAIPIVLIVLLIRWLIRKGKAKKQTAKKADAGTSETPEKREDALAEVKKE